MKFVIEAEAKETASRNQEAVKETMCDLFQRYGFSSELITKAVDVTEDLAEKWINGSETPNATYCVKLARHMGCSLYTLYLAILSTPIKG